jgi:tetratricopeptide (TPR) repeat protein
VATAILLLAVSTATVAGKTAHRIGVSRFQLGDISGAERMFRMAIGVDPFCDTYPDAMAALGHRLYLEGIRGGNPDPLRAKSLLTESIRWEAKAVSLSRRDFRMTSRLSRLFVDRYGVSRREEDLSASIDWADRALEINPYSAEKLWDRAELLILDRRPVDAVADLTRAVSIEPNFCRGYAKLAGMTKGKDDPQSLAWEAHAEKCREAARGRALEENERWLVEEPGSRPKPAAGRNEGGEPESPHAFSPPR